MLQRLLLCLAVVVGICDSYAISADDVRLPNGPAVVVPPPKPDAVQNLGVDELYVVDSDVELKVFASPQGVVSVTTEPGPMKMKAKFIDSAKTETRVFAGKFLYTIEGLKTGTVELIMLKPNGEVIRRSLSVGVPTPTPPVPPVVPTTFAAKLQDLYSKNKDAASKDKLLTILNAVNGQDYKNFDDMESVLSKTGQKFLPNNELRPLRDAIGDEILKRCGSNPSSRDVSKAKEVYKEAIDALKGV